MHRTARLPWTCVVISLAGCEPEAAAPAQEPLPADMVAACPGIDELDRRGAGACTEIGCTSGLWLQVSPDSGWRAGAYRFELDLDGRSVTCQGSLPLKPCGERSFVCDDDEVSLGESGCALSETSQGIASIQLPGYPRALSVRVTLDANPIVTTQLTPTYVTGQPNGAGCPPVCCSASADLNVPVAP